MNYETTIVSLSTNQRPGISLLTNQKFVVGDGLNPFGIYPTALIAHEKFRTHKISLRIIGLMVLKTTGLNPGF